MVEDEPLPDFFIAAFNQLIGIIEAEVAAASGEPPGPEMRARTGSLVAIAHGHCMFALNGTHALFGDWVPREAALARIREALAPPPVLSGSGV
jgi:hypothetical protein